MLVTNFRLKYYLYRIVQAAYQLNDVGYMHPLRERQKKALAETVDFIEEYMPDALGLETQRELIDYALKNLPKQGCVLEFGVFKGGTIRYMARRLRERQFFGFDSFEGLPENWAGFSMDTDSFDLRKKMPKVPKNVELVAGWYDKTLPIWVKKHADENIALMHIDCDIYSSTRTIFNTIGDKIDAGTLILFDEFFNYPGWQFHEVKAFNEFCSDQKKSFRYVAYSRQQVLVEIL